MASRRSIPPLYDERFRPSPEMVHPDAIHPMEPLPPPLVLENTLTSQEAEIEQLARDNHKLASSHLALRQDLVAVQQEADKLREHIRSTQTEGDIQVRILLDKIAKAEADIRARETVKKELQEAHNEVQSLETTRQELNAQIQHSTKELEKSCEDLKKLPEMRAELDNLRQEHEKLREMFIYEKGVNTKKGEELKTLEKDLIRMAEEVARLQYEVSNTKTRPSGPVPPPGPPPFHGHVGYVDNFGTPHLPAVGSGTSVMEGIIPYSSGAFVVGPPPINAPAASAAAGNCSWGGPPLVNAAAANASVSNPSWGNPPLINTPAANAASGNPSWGGPPATNAPVASAAAGNPSWGGTPATNAPVASAATGNPSLGCPPATNAPVASATSGNPSWGGPPVINAPITSAAASDPSWAGQSASNAPAAAGIPSWGGMSDVSRPQ